MKTNLKTFPRKGTPQSYERWKKAFKQELREIQRKHSLPEDDFGINLLVKEILGEEAAP